MTHHDAPSGQPYSEPPIWDGLHIGEMRAGEEGWTVPWAVTTTPIGLYINSDYLIEQRPGGMFQMHLRRTEDGLIVTHEGDDDHPRILGMRIPPDRIIAGWPHLPPPTPPTVPNPGISERRGGDGGGGKGRSWLARLWAKVTGA